MFVEKILRLNNSLALNDFASTLICGKDENDKPMFCDYFQVIKVYDDFAILFGSSSTTPHSEFICSDFEMFDRNNIASEKLLDDAKQKWFDFLTSAFGEKYVDEYFKYNLNNETSFQINI